MAPASTEALYLARVCQESNCSTFIVRLHYTDQCSGIPQQLKECFTGENTPPLPCYVLIQLYI